MLEAVLVCVAGLELEVVVGLQLAVVKAGTKVGRRSLLPPAGVTAGQS